MAHLLRRLGAAALKPRIRGDGRILPAMISTEEAMQLRAQFYAAGQPWPYEDLVPGPPQKPYNADAYLARAAEREQRRKARSQVLRMHLDGPHAPHAHS